MLITAHLKLLRYEVEAALWLGVPFFVPLPLMAYAATLAVLLGAAIGAVLALA